jgi:hypothetical protein
MAAKRPLPKAFLKKPKGFSGDASGYDLLRDLGKDDGLRHPRLRLTGQRTRKSFYAGCSRRFPRGDGAGAVLAAPFFLFQFSFFLFNPTLASASFLFAGC